jgi:surfeit locus 1 family protein
MIRFPILPTILVAAAVATMIGLGVWQLGRIEDKEALIRRYAQAEGLAPITWPRVPPTDDSLLYRTATGYCAKVTGWAAVAGQNAAGESGWSHIAGCRTGAEGTGMQVDMGWSRTADAPMGWSGGEVRGIIAPDKAHRIRLVSTKAAPGLQPSARPNPSATPNNHLLYAVQWFFFAAAATVIYLLALRRRQKNGPPPPGA